MRSSEQFVVHRKVSEGSDGGREGEGEGEEEEESERLKTPSPATGQQPCSLAALYDSAFYSYVQKESHPYCVSIINYTLHETNLTQHDSVPVFMHTGPSYMNVVLSTSILPLYSQVSCEWKEKK